MKTRLALVLVALVLGLGGCATVPLPPAPTIPEIVQMSKQGVPAEEIVRRMQESRAVYRLSGSELAKLKSEGVPDKVLDYIQQAQVNQARYEEWVRSRDAYYWYGPYYGPYYGFSYGRSWGSWGHPGVRWRPF